MPAQFDAVKIDGPDEQKLAHDVSLAVAGATARGMRIEAAVCVVASVAADYARLNLGADYLDALAAVVRDREAWAGNTLKMTGKKP